MIRLLLLLSRSIPLMIALAVIGIVVYFVVSWRRSPAIAKEILIRVFLILCSIISVSFLVISIYSLADHNDAVFELALSCLVVGIVGLVITLICRWRFKKNNPHYKDPVNAKAKPINNKPDTLKSVIDILTAIDNRRKKQ